MISNQISSIQDNIQEFIEIVNTLRDIKIDRIQKKVVTGDNLLKKLLFIIIKFLSGSKFDKYFLSWKQDHLNLIEKLDKHFNELEFVLEEFRNIDWGNLYIALFGETNAGKSTLIEALIGGEGNSIGTGEKDFTKEARIYKYKEHIFLMDLPGIEGNEEIFQRIIKQNLTKANIVFYVFRDSKEPERGTLEKVKNYLSGYTYLYGILNISGLKPPKLILNDIDRIEKLKKRTEKHLRKIFGNKFKKIIPLHILYAYLLASKNINNQNLLKKKNFLLKNLTSVEDESLRMFLSTSQVESIINDYYQYKDKIILWSNMQKILYIKYQTLNLLFYYKTKTEEYIKLIGNLLDETLLDFYKKNNKFIKDIGKLIDIRLKNLNHQLKTRAYDLIEQDVSNKKIEEELENIKQKFQEQLIKEIEIKIQNYKTSLGKRTKHLRKKLNYLKEAFEHITFNIPEDSINIEEVKEKLIRVIFMIFAIFRNFLVGIISAVMELALTYFIGKDKIKAEKKEKISKHIDEKIQELQEKLDYFLIQKIKTELDKYNQEISDNFDQIKIQLQEPIKIVENVIKQAVINYLLDIDILKKELHIHDLKFVFFEGARFYLIKNDKNLEHFNEILSIDKNSILSIDEALKRFKKEEPLIFFYENFN